jgi:hypothetical protein
MWKCDNCLEDEIKDKYKNCWNCGTPKPTALETVQRVVRDVPKISEPITRKKSETVKEVSPKIEPKPIIEEPIILEPQASAEPKPVVENEFLSTFEPPPDDSSVSKIKTAIFVLWWLTALIATAVFAYFSNQKTVNFDHRILAEAQSFRQQKDKFVFPEANLPNRKNQLVAEGNLKGKVLPLIRKDNEIAPLYNNLPDDLRPSNLDEVKNWLWLDCRFEAIERYQDGSKGFQEKCNGYLVERETAKVIGIQEFLGTPPAFAKQSGEGDKKGYVLPERYISYLREKQPEAERTTLKYASDSPNHHFFNKSEFIFAIVLLCLLGAIGLGWLAYKIKFDWRKEP